MLKIFGDWYIDADPHQYILGKLKKRARDGRTSLEIDKPTYHPTIAAAVNHVLEAELRQKVADGSVTSFTKMLDAYSAISEALLKEVREIPDNMKRAVKNSFDFE